jgi:hypothetical protein
LIVDLFDAQREIDETLHFWIELGVHATTICWVSTSIKGLRLPLGRSEDSPRPLRSEAAAAVRTAAAVVGAGAGAARVIRAAVGAVA